MQVCVSTGGSGLALLDTGAKNDKLLLLLKNVSSNLETFDFWFSGAYFGPAGSMDVTYPSMWSFFPTWDVSDFNSTLTPHDRYPWLWKDSFPSVTPEYYTNSEATKYPNSCMIVHYNTSSGESWWEQRACGGSSVSAFVCNPPTPSM